MYVCVYRVTNSICELLWILTYIHEGVRKNMQNLRWKKNVQNFNRHRIWEGLGLYLGRVWRVWGICWALLNDFCSSFWRSKWCFFQAWVQKWTPRSLSDRFWEGLGRIWVGFGGSFGQHFGRFWCFCVGCGQLLDAFGKMWPCCGEAYKLDPRADPRSVTIKKLDQLTPK